MSPAFAHTCLRVVEPEASVRFYGVLGFERHGRLNFDTAYNVYLSVPGDGDVLRLTVNIGRSEPYAVGDGFDHVAVAVGDLDARPRRAGRDRGAAREPAYRPDGRDDLPRIAFVAAPDSYRVELVEGERFATPQDGPHPRRASPGRPRRAGGTPPSDGRRARPGAPPRSRPRRARPPPARAQALAQVRGVKVARGGGLLDEHEHVVAGDLHVTLALGEALDVGLARVEPKLRRLEQRQQRLVLGQDGEASRSPCASRPSRPRHRRPGPRGSGPRR